MSYQDQRAGTHQSGEDVGAHPAHLFDYLPAWYRAAQCHSDACQQGRTPCPTPDACRQPDVDDFGAVGSIVRLWPALITAWALIAAIVGFFWLVTP